MRRFFKSNKLVTFDIGIGVGFAVVAGGIAVANAFASGAVVTLVTAVVAFIGIRLVIRCLR